METTHPFPTPTGGHGFVSIQGKVYHRIRSSHYNSAIRWLLHDGFLQHLPPHVNWASTIPSAWKTALTNALTRLNPLVHALQNLSAQSVHIPNARLILHDSGSTSEIAAIMCYDNSTQLQARSRTLVISKVNGRTQQIPTVSRMWEPLAYPLLFPEGTLGWGLPSVQDTIVGVGAIDGATTTQMWYYRALLLREDRFKIFGRLTNEYLVDMFSRDLDTRLDYIRRNQLRIQEEDAVLMGDPDMQPTENVYLPSSFLGSRRWASSQIADSLTIASHLGHPTFFITMTCNPEWPEIQQRLRPGQDFTDIPLDVARVFKQKLVRLLQAVKDLFPNAGRQVYSIHSVEFQKRGLPHAHILIKFESDCVTPADIDAVVSAEMPLDPSDAALITKFMLHNHPLSNLPRSKYCQVERPDGSRYCRFNYPFPVRQETTIDEGGRVHYRRRRPGDEMVVPHILQLIRKFRCHINVEVANTSHLFQYIFKYIHKGECQLFSWIAFIPGQTLILGIGPDTTKYTVQVPPTPHQPANPDVVDEIDDFWKARYLSAGEAAWRILGFHVTKKNPSVTALPIHLPGSNRRFQYARTDGSESQLSLLDRYFLRSNASFQLGNNERSISSLTYLEYYAHFRLVKYNPENDNRPNYFPETPNPTGSPRMHAVLRGSTNVHLTRIHHVRPSDGEVFYLRTILQSKAVKSFEDARTANGVVFLSFQEAAGELGLFADSAESTLTLMEAVASLRTPRQLRMLFGDLLVNDCIEFPLATWQQFALYLAADCTIQNNGSDDLGRSFALADIGRILDDHGKTLDQYGLPNPVIPALESLQEIQRWGSDPNALIERAIQSFNTFNGGQKFIFQTVFNAVLQDQPLRLFIDGKAGTGKTTILRALCDAVRGLGRIILPTATSAFAAQLYDGGRTTHSTFKVRDVL